MSPFTMGKLKEIQSRMNKGLKKFKKVFDQ